MPKRRMDSQLELSHVRREVKTALELAIVALAPPDLLDELGAIAGLLDAINELPLDSPPARTLLPKVFARAKTSLAQWQSWEKKREKPSA
jgi:hypothetical protein